MKAAEIAKGDRLNIEKTVELLNEWKPWIPPVIAAACHDFLELYRFEKERADGAVEQVRALTREGTCPGEFVVALEEAEAWLREHDRAKEAP